MHGLPIFRLPGRPLAVLDRGSGGGSGTALVHAAALARADLDSWFGVPVTSVARTVVDIARDSGRRAGLIAADAALREGATTRAELERALARACRWPGVIRARQIVEHASPLAESALESLTRLLIIDADLPVPELQAQIGTLRGVFRVDSLWRDRRVILEADGLLKYDSPDALRREKLRQEALEQAGYIVIRVTWDEVMHRRTETARRITRALRRHVR